MSQNPKRSDTGGLWTQLTGAPEEFPMENRAFNYVCVITFFVLVYYLACDSYIAQYLMCGVILVLIFILCCLYYFSRFRKKVPGCYHRLCRIQLYRPDPELLLQFRH
jgi:hypothetical protein